MQFNRSGPNSYTYTDGAHTFDITKVHVVNVPNSKGYNILHTGPRPDVAAERRRKRQKQDDVRAQINEKPINLMRDVKVQIALWLLNMTEHERAAVKSQPKDQVAA